MESIDVKIFHGKEGFYKIKDDWDHIVNTMTHTRIGHVYEGYKAYIDALDEGDDQSIFFVLIHRNNKPISICPMERTVKKVLGMKLCGLQIALAKEIDIGDFIYEKRDDNKGLMNFLMEKLEKALGYDWKCITFLILEDSSIYFSLKNSQALLSMSVKEGSVYYLKFGSYEEIHKSVSKNFRGNLKQARNRLARQDKVEFLSIRNKKDLNWAFQEFIEIEGGGWKGERGTSIKSDRQIKQFYENSLIAFSNEGKCEINLLKVNDKSIAGSLCFLTDDTIYVTKVGYDENHSYLRPGLILFDELIKRHSEDDSIREVNMCSDASWFAKWKPLSMNVYRITIFNKSLGGLFYLALFKCKSVKKKINESFLNAIGKKNELHP